MTLDDGRASFSHDLCCVCVCVSMYDCVYTDTTILVILCEEISVRTFLTFIFGSVQFSSVTQSCPTLCDPMNCSTPGLPVHHQLLDFTQTHVHRVSNAIQPSHPLHPLLLLPSIFPSIRVFSKSWPLLIQACMLMANCPQTGSKSLIIHEQNLAFPWNRNSIIWVISISYENYTSITQAPYFLFIQKLKKYLMCMHSVESDSAILWTADHQAPLFMGFPRQEYWSGLLFPSPGDVLNPGIDSVSSALQADSLSLSHLRNPKYLILPLNNTAFLSSTSFLVTSLAFSMYQWIQ